MNQQAHGKSRQTVREFYDHALKFRNAGDLEEAESICRRANAIYRRDPNILCLLGEVILKQKRPQEAGTWFDAALKNFPEYPRALEGAGRALLAEGKPGRALKFLAPAAQAVPNRYSTHLYLGRALAMAGQGEEAEAAYQRALDLNPDKAALAQAAEDLGEGRHGEAERRLRDFLSRKPEDPAALRLLASIALETFRVEQAIRLLRRAVAKGPDFTQAWHDLAIALLKQDHFDEALEAAERVIALEPEAPYGHILKGNVHAKAQRHEDAIAVFRGVLEKFPANGAAFARLGHVLKTIGRTGEAIAVFRQCIEAHPALGEVYWNLANLKTFLFAPQEIEVMERMVEEPGLPDESRVNFYYSLGKHYEHEERFEKAFERYRRGAELRRPHETYDPVQTRVIHDRIMEVFSADFLAERDGWGEDDAAPILVVGLPRSGSTLIEQILASHSQVEGTQELPDLSRCVTTINRHGKQGMSYPEAVRIMNKEDLGILARQYLEGTRRYRSGSAFFIDKMPNNFPSIGLLHLMLPHAKVINARRHPLDSCLGSWKQLFFNGQSFTYDFFELGQYYLEYERLMNHWHAVLPGKVLDVHYEAVVDDQERQTRRMLEHLGLPFEAQCLRFWETERAVNTASSEQVRQPLYTGAVNYWRNYEPWLGELIEQLEPLLRDLPREDQPDALGAGR